MRWVVFIVVFSLQSLGAQTVCVSGQIKSERNGESIAAAIVRDLNGNSVSQSDKDGKFRITLPRRERFQLHIQHTAYQPFTKEIKVNKTDSCEVKIYLREKIILMDSISVYAVNKPETLVGKPNYSVHDFDFYEDKLILLTAEKSLSKARLRFSDYQGKIISDVPLPKEAGAARSFFHDYEGYTDLLCSDTVYRIDFMQDEFLLMPIGRQAFEKGIKPVIDTVNQRLYYSDQWEQYPLFHYYFLGINDTASNHLATICNPELMKIYNMEYFYLPPRMQLEARRIADAYKTDKCVVAALMSGFTKSLYYEPAYAPLFVLNDTLCIFNHYTDHIYHIDKRNRLIDSVKISYHHPKNWREWKRQLFVDRFQNKVYAFFSRDGHHYLKEINFQNGKVIRTYKLKHHSAEKIKIRDGYVYYVYRPFESTQEKFLYRERIE